MMNEKGGREGEAMELFWIEVEVFKERRTKVIREGKETRRFDGWKIGVNVRMIVGGGKLELRRGF
jgi:hypothetical protein